MVKISGIKKKRKSGKRHIHWGKCKNSGEIKFLRKGELHQFCGNRGKATNVESMTKSHQKFLFFGGQTQNFCWKKVKLGKNSQALKKSETEGMHHWLWGMDAPAQRQCNR